MNIIIPLAGKDDRFDIYNEIKPLVNIGNKPLIKHCTDSLSFFSQRRKINFIVLKEHNDKYKIKERLTKLYEKEHDVKVFMQNKALEGAACTVLQLKDSINSDEPLVIYLADIYFDINVEEMIEKMKYCDGLVPTFKSSNKKYSYLRLEDDKNSESKAVEVAEKSVISDNASAGFYYFKKGRNFVSAAEEMIKKDRRVNNIFYICPVYQEMVESKKIVKIIQCDFKFGLGSPEEVEAFKKSM